MGDGEPQLEAVVRATADYGGSFVMGGGLTMDGVQADRTLEAYGEFDPGLVDKLRALYRWEAGGEPAYGPPRSYNARLGRTIRELCGRHNLLDRMPRYIPPGPLAVNKRIAERLFLRTYDLELEEASDRRIWAYRKAAWTVDGWPKSVADIVAEKGIGGLQELPNIGKSLAGQMATWLQAERSDGGVAKPK